MSAFQCCCCLLHFFDVECATDLPAPVMLKRVLGHPHRTICAVLLLLLLLLLRFSLIVIIIIFLSASIVAAIAAARTIWITIVGCDCCCFC